MARRCSHRAGRTAMMCGLVVVLVVAYIKPLRNTLLYPVWPSQWRPLGSYRLLDMHVRDFFFPMDLRPYTGPCGDVAQRIQQLGIIRMAGHLNRTFRVYTQWEWERAENELRRRYDSVTVRQLRFFRPALTEEEQRTLLRNLFVATTALEAFNVSYMAAEGTLIGSLRHGGLIPWDDDGDIIFKAEQWPVAKRVLSCIPGFELKIGSDFLWKFYSLDSPYWKGEVVTRFPYVDLFPYVEDEEYVWPLVIWLKDKILWPRHQVVPVRHVRFDNFRILSPHDRTGVLSHLFGDINICESRLFERRERKLMPGSERIRIDCKLLNWVYPIFSSKIHPNET